MRAACKGSITVFLSLMLALMITVCSVCLESAHQEAVGAELAMKSEEAGMNLFSHFEKTLYEKYDLLALNDRLTVKDMLKDSMKGKAGEEKGIFHLNYELEGIDLENTLYLGDKNGEGFQREVNEVITEELLKKLKAEISNYLKAAKESERISEQVEMISKEQGNLTSLLEQYMEFPEACTNMKRVGDAMYGALEEYYNLSIHYEIGDMAFDAKTLSARKALHYDQERLKYYCSEILDKIFDYKQLALKISTNTKSAKKALNDDSLSKESKDLLVEQLQAIRDMTEPDGKSYKKVLELETSMKAISLALEKSLYPELEPLLQALNQYKDITPFFDPGYKLLDQVKKLEFAEEKELSAGGDGASAKKLLKTVKQIMEKGPFAYIVGDTEKLSKRKVEMKEMPSMVYEKNSSEDTEHILRRILEESAEAFTMNLYLTQYMDCYRDGDHYDLEYILGGKNEDQKNLKIVIDQLVLVRSALNLVYLMKDSEKSKEVELAAVALSAGIGLPALQKVASFVILYAWAYSEAVLDVKALVEGEKVPFFKTKDCWRLDLESASEVKKNMDDKIKSDNGLCYKEYLRLMLFFHSRVRNLYRGLDMIQWNLCKEDGEFRISQCIYETGIKVEARAPFLFLSNSMKNQILPDVNKLCLSQKVGYCSVEWPV